MIISYILMPLMFDIAVRLLGEIRCKSLKELEGERVCIRYLVSKKWCKLISRRTQRFFHINLF